MTRHNLFLSLSGDDDDESEGPEIHLLYVRRKESIGWLYIPGEFTPDELPDIGTLYARFGGGSYEIIARNSRGQITARQIWELAGAPLPLVPAPPSVPAQMPQSQPIVQHGDSTASLILASLPAVLTFVGNMMNNNNQVLIAAMGAAKKDDSSPVLMELIKGNAATNTELLRASLAPKPAGDGSWREGFEAGRQDQAPQEETSAADILQGVANIAGAVLPAFAQRPQAPAPVQAPQQPLPSLPLGDG